MLLRILGIFGLGGIFVAGGFFVSAESGRKKLENDTNVFLQLVADGDLKEAYERTGESFRKVNPFESFQTMMRVFRLDEYASAEWDKRGFEGDSGLMVGTITTKEGKTFPAELNMIKEEDTWRLAGVYKAGESSTD